MDRIKKLKIKKQDGTFSDYIPIGADAENIDTTDGESVETKLNKKPYYYNSVADMKADNKLKAGDMAITLGYYEANDGGGAEYKIISNTNAYKEFLNNGLFAELIIKDNVYKLAQFGIINGQNIVFKEIYDIVLSFAKKTGGTILIPAGTFYTENLNLASNITLSGCGKGVSILKQFPSDANVWRNVIYDDTDKENIVIKDFTIIGYAIEHKTQNREAGRPIEIRHTKNIIIKNLEIKWFSMLGLCLLDSYNVVIENNILEHIGRDAINCSGCKNITVTNNIINHCGDDGIAVHDATNQTIYVPQYIKGIIISNNNLYNSGGISCIAGQQVNISNNTIKFSRGTGIVVKKASDTNNLSQSHAVIIDGNIITDSFTQSGGRGIIIGGGPCSSIDYDTLKNTKPELLKGANNYIAHNFIITNNIIMQTMESQTVSGVDWNQLASWTLPFELERGIDFQGALRNITISNNRFNRCSYAIVQTTNVTTMSMDMLISKNTFTRVSHGIQLVCNSTSNPDSKNKNYNIMILDNIFDCDPYLEASNRNSDGSWTSSGPGYSAIWLDGVLEVFIKGNYFRNCCLLVNGTKQRVCDNYIEVATCYNFDNYDWGSVVYGQQYGWRTANKTFSFYDKNIPSTGTYSKGDIVYNINPQAGGYLGWICVSGGTPGTWKGFGIIES